MASQVGKAEVAVFPTFKGFRKLIDLQTGTATKQAGAAAGKGFKNSFETSAKGIGSAALKSLTSEVAKASRDVSNARLKELDATGRVRVAESALADARSRYASGSTQVVRAEERLATANRSLVSTQAALTSSTTRLTSAKRGLADATDSASKSGGRLGGVFRDLPSIFSRSGSTAASSFGGSFRTNLGQIFGGNLLADLAQSAGRVIGRGIGAAVALGLDSVNLASQLEQSSGAVEAVFKDQSGIIKTFAETASRDVGLAKNSYQQFATVVGAQLKNLGVPFDQIGGKTGELISLGADLAAQFGGPTSDAVGAISSLLRGERDPIERYGVSLKQVDIDARKAAMGLGDLTGEAEKQADIQATLSLLYEQTSAAQGTFFNESDTYAGKQARLNAQLEDTRARLGEALLPAFSSLATFADITVLPAIDRMADRIGPKLGEALTLAAPKVEELFLKLEPLLDTFGGFVAEDGIPGLIDGLDQIVEAAPGWIEAFKQIDTAVYNFDTEFRNLQDDLQNARLDRIQWWDDIVTGITEGQQEIVSEQLGVKAGEVVGDNTKAGLDSKKGVVTEAAKSGLRDFLNNPTAGLPSPVQIGQNFGQGFADGILAKRDTVSRAATSLGDTAVLSIGTRLQIKSPSRVTFRQGAFTGEGFALGMLSTKGEVMAAAESIASIPAIGIATTVGSTGSTGVATVGGGSGNVYIDKIVAPDQNPVVSGRIMAREFVRVKAG